jgi:hypothetical protein
MNIPRTSILSHKWICLFIFDFLIPVGSNTSLSRYIEMIDAFRKVRSTIPMVCTQWHNFVRDWKNLSVDTLHIRLFGISGSIHDLQWRYEVLRTLKGYRHARMDALNDRRIDEYFDDDADDQTFALYRERLQYMIRIEVLSNLPWKLHVCNIRLYNGDDSIIPDTTELRKMFHNFPADRWLEGVNHSDLVFNAGISLPSSVMVKFGRLTTLLEFDTQPDIKPHGIFDRTLLYNTDMNNVIGSVNIIGSEYQTSITYDEAKQIICVIFYFRVSEIIYRMFGVIFTGCLLGSRISS